MTLDLTPNYWLSLAIIAVPIVLLTLLGVLVIRLVGRAAERRYRRATANCVRLGLITRTEARQAPLGTGVEAVISGNRIYNFTLEFPSEECVPITYRDLPPFVRRRRPGESFTEFSRRIGL